MSEFELETEQSIHMANSNHQCRPDGDRYILMRESQARNLVERVQRCELALRPKPKSELDRRIENLRAAMPYICAALAWIISLIIGQAM